MSENPDDECGCVPRIRSGRNWSGWANRCNPPRPNPQKHIETLAGRLATNAHSLIPVPRRGLDSFLHREYLAANTDWETNILCFIESGQGSVFFRSSPLIAHVKMDILRFLLFHRQMIGHDLFGLPCDLPQPDHSVENGVKPPHPPSSKRFTGSRDLPAHANDSPRSQLQFGRSGTPGMTVPMLGRYLGRDLVLLQNQSSDPQLIMRPCRVHTYDPARRPD